MEVQLLGPLVVWGDRGPISVGAQKERALVARLALSLGRVVSVGELVDALWGAAPPPTATKTLQSHVSRLRRALGAGLVLTERPGYVLDLPAEFVDVGRFDRLVEQARRETAAGRPRLALDHLLAAAALWRGDPLPDLQGSEAGRSEIARLVELRHVVGEELLETRLALGQHRSALPDLEARVREAPLRERGWALLLIALYRSGRQTDALRAYQTVRSLLINKVGVEPGPMLRELETAIIAHAPSLDLEPANAAQVVDGAPDRDGAGPDEHPLPPSLEWVRRSLFPFGGRDAELAILETGWDRAVADSARHAVLVGGEPGIGKTRLVGEAALAARARGALVLFGRCDEGLGVPYQPFVEALGAALRDVPDVRLAQVIGPLGGELTRLLPELRSRAVPLEPPVVVDADTERHRLFEAVSELIENLSAEQPVMLVLDDLQWATMPTLLMLRHVLMTTRPARLLVTGTYRTTDLDRIYPLADVLADLRRHEHVRRIGLEGLAEDATVELAVTAAGHDLDNTDRGLIRRVHRECGGNPFFFWTLLTHLIETGLIVRRDGRWTHADAALDTPLPEGIREVVARRLSSLDDDANALLRVAALVGSEFDYRLVAAVANVDEADALDLLETARAAAVLEERAGAYGQFVFSHDLIRRSLVEEHSTTRRARLHWQIAETLRTQDGDLGTEHLDALARHYMEGALAGDPLVAGAVVQRAGDAALDALAFEEAAAYYEDGLSLVEGDEDRRFELLLAKGRALQWAGNPAYREVLNEAVALARRREDPDRLARAVLELHVNTYLKITGTSDAELRMLLDEALEGIGETDVALRARLCSSLALAMSFSEKRERPDELANEALALARRSGDAQLLAEVLIDRIWVIAGPDTLTERLSLATEAIQVAEQLDDRLALANAGNCLNQVLFEAGEIDAAADALGRGIEAAEFLRRPMLRWGLMVHEASLAFVRGDVAELERWGNDLAATADEAGVEPHAAAAVNGRFLFAAKFEQGRLAELHEAVAALVHEQPDVDWVILLGVIQAETGSLAPTSAIVERLRAHRPKRDITWFAFMMFATIVAAAADDRAWAGRLYAELLPYAGRNSNDGAGTSGPVDLGLGRAATVLGRYGDAERHFDAAAGLCHAWRAPMWSAHTMYEHALMLRRREGVGDAARAHSLLDECLSLARANGQTRLVTRIHALEPHT